MMTSAARDNDPQSDEQHGVRFCDLVMKGGVTSGVVYPLTVCRLAERYLFRSIGGTSVGAIAAVLTAAAEFQRRNGSAAGFRALSDLPNFLGGRGALLRLFRPDGLSSRMQLTVALRLIGTAPLPLRIFHALGLLALVYWPVVVLVVVLEMTLLGPGSIDRLRFWVALLTGFAACVTLLLALYLMHTYYTLGHHDFGWCHGHDRAAKPAADGKHKWPLIDWLSDAIDDAAGLELRKKPLTFGQLWDAPRLWRPFDDDPVRSIDLRTVTTCLTLARPFTIPLDEFSANAHTFYYKRSDFERYFSKYVLAYLDSLLPQNDQRKDLRLLPDARHLPVVVAARMSMSFPILFCAVPLYTKAADNTMRRVWFSDGGLTSNMPIHFFDSPLPRWPTFALNLLGSDRKKPSGPPVPPYDPGSVFLEYNLALDEIDPWGRLDDKRGAGKVLTFVMSIIETMRTWQDRVLGRMPGFADRTVAVRLADDEGGLNLNMTPEQIRDMTRLGDTAGEELVSHFAPSPFPSDSPFWIGHRWTRYRATMSALCRWLDAFAGRYAPFTGAPWQETYDSLIGRAIVTPPGDTVANVPYQPAAGFDTPEDAASAQQASQTVASLRQNVVDGKFDPAAPGPKADLATRAPY